MSRKLIALMALAALLVLALPAGAQLDPRYSEEWDRRGSDSLECGKLGESPERTAAGWIHWIFSTKGASTNAELVLGGSGGGTYSPGNPLNAETWHFFTPYFDVNGLTATIKLYGGLPGSGGGLVISDYCPGYRPLTATKTANGSYDRTVTWDLAKSVAPETHTGYAGQIAGSSTWTVVATKFESLGNYVVTGTITINNPNGINVDFGVSDTLDDGTVAAVSCDTYTVPANGSVNCFYTASPGGKTATKNTAVVTAHVGGATAEANITWTENPIGFDSGTLSDPRFGYSEIISGSTTKTFPETFECPADAALYNRGSYSYDVENTAYLNGNIGLERSATVRVTCTLPALVPSKTAAGEWDRTVEWELAKSVDPASHTGYAGEVAGSSTWTVVATKTDSGPQNYRVEGTISVYNPAAIPQTFTVMDLLDDGPPATATAAAVTCPTYTVPAGSTVTCTYVANPPNSSATRNIVVVTAPGNLPQSDSVAIGWTENLTGFDEGTLSDPRFGYSVIISGSTTKTFPETFECPADAALYNRGSYSYDVENTAYLNGNIGLERSATVDVTCTLPALVPSKTAAGSYSRDITWTLEKTVDPEILYGYSGGTADTATWTVVATKSIGEPYGFKVEGTISIYNPAAIAQTFTVMDVLSDNATYATVTCPTYTVPAGGTVECTYIASPLDSLANRNKVVVTAPGNLPKSDSAAIAWTENLIGPESGTLMDPRFGYSELISESTSVVFVEEFVCPSFYDADYSEGTYEYSEENTAELNDEIDLEASATVKVICEIGYEYETAYARGVDGEMCFIPTFNNWGWTIGPLGIGVNEYELWAAAGQCDTSKGTYVGSVNVSYGDDGVVKVTFNIVDAPYIISETHVYAGSDPYPLDKKGNPTVAPGQYTIAPNLSGEIYVIAHAVVGFPQ